jgi:hypothetical protein
MPKARAILTKRLISKGSKNTYKGHINKCMPKPSSI